MKKAITGILVCILAAADVLGDEYREFTDMQGRAIKAKIVEFDSAKGKLLIEREGGKQIWVPPSIFSEPDKVFIKEWIAADQMLSEKNLRISFRKQSESADRKATDNGFGFNGSSINYEITLENSSAQPIEKLKIEYRYFITVKNVATHDKYARQIAGELLVDRIDAMSSEVVMTDEVLVGEKIKSVWVRDNKGVVQGSEDQKVSKEDFQGIWLKLHGPPIGGEEHIRNASYPDDLKHLVVWEENIPELLEKTYGQGIAGSSAELFKWIREAVRMIDEATDDAQLDAISKSMEVVYNEEVDISGQYLLIAGVAFYLKGEYELAASWFEKDQLEDNWFAHIVLADMYATGPASFCDGGKALRNLEIARKQENSSGDKNPGILSLEASAYARSGQFDQAVKLQQKAIDNLSVGHGKFYGKQFERCLALYNSKKAYERQAEDMRCWNYNFQLNNKPIWPRGDISWLFTYGGGAGFKE